MGTWRTVRENKVHHTSKEAQEDGEWIKTRGGFCVGFGITVT